jgi:hypothetical protein
VCERERDTITVRDNVSESLYENERESIQVCVCGWVEERERERERKNLSGGVLQTNWCNWPMKDLRSQVGSKTLGMPTEQGNRICHLLGHP